jgi:hypothetical protein
MHPASSNSDMSSKTVNAPINEAWWQIDRPIALITTGDLQAVCVC